MKLQHHLTITYLLLTFLLIGNANSEELFPYKGIQASVANDYHCQSSVSVRLDAKTEDQIRQSRLDMQELSNMVKTYLWLDCEGIESITYEGFVEGNDKRIYQAVAKKQDKWYLDEKVPENSTQEDKIKKKVATIPNKDEPKPAKQSKKQKAQKKKSEPSTLEELEKSSAKGAVEAMIELAKGLLGLSDADPNIKFPKNSERGIELLEKLASDGNLDAKHLLGEAYQSNSQLTMNLPLLEKITTNLPENVSQQRGKVAAQLTIESAAKGGKEAIVALKEAGQSGSGLSYYALGMMYLLDKLKQMPVDADFIQEELKLDTGTTGGSGFGNADIGLHFLTLAAEKGNAEAQGLLKEMEVDFNTPSQNQAQTSMPSQNTSANSTAAQPPPSGSATSNNTLAQGMELLEIEKLDDALQAGSASASQTKDSRSGTAINNLQPQMRSGGLPSGLHDPRLPNRRQGKKPTGNLSAPPTKQNRVLSSGYSSEANQNTTEKPIEILD